MQLLLPPKITDRLVSALNKAGSREVGGILMGEHIADGLFRVKDLTIQRRTGGFAHFIRVVQDVISPLWNFFCVTNYNYERFNYLGEWHSHPSFIPEPSQTDHNTMRDIIEDPAVGARFVVLLIVRLGVNRTLEGSVTVYRPRRKQFRGQLILEINHEQTKQETTSRADDSFAP